jgi:hypothetical protein
MMYSEMLLREHRLACDQELKKLVHEQLPDLAKNISVLVHTEGFLPLDCSEAGGLCMR